MEGEGAPRQSTSRSGSEAKISFERYKTAMQSSFMRTFDKVRCRVTVTVRGRGWGRGRGQDMGLGTRPCDMTLHEFGERAKPFWRHLHTALHIAVRRVKPRRYQQQVGLR